jgi:hypothetical protein
MRNFKTDAAERDAENSSALDRPMVGDMWAERIYCLDFIVVEVLPDDNVRVIEAETNNEDRQHFPFENAKVVDRGWMQQRVKYKHIDGFLCDVFNTEKSRRVAEEWRLDFIDRLQEEMDRVSGWAALKA